MTLKRIVLIRLNTLFTEVTSRTIDLTRTKPLGEQTGLDGDALRSLLPVFNGTATWEGKRLGFDDMLPDGEAIVEREIRPGKTVSPLIDAIIKRSEDGVGTIAKYRQKMAERARLGLRRVVARLAHPPIGENEIDFDKRLRDYVPRSSSPRVAFEINQDLFKYLFAFVSERQLVGKLSTIRERLTAMTTGS